LRFIDLNHAIKRHPRTGTAREVGNAARHIQERHVANCSKADPAYGEGVADALKRFAAGEL
jgi:catalase